MIIRPHKILYSYLVEGSRPRDTKLNEVLVNGEWQEDNTGVQWPNSIKTWKICILNQVVISQISQYGNEIAREFLLSLQLGRFWEKKETTTLLIQRYGTSWYHLKWHSSLEEQSIIAFPLMKECQKWGFKWWQNVTVVTLILWKILSIYFAQESFQRLSGLTFLLPLVLHAWM